MHTTRETPTERAAAPQHLLPTHGDGAEVVAKFFRALGDPTRLRLLEFLLHAEHTVSECVAHVGLSQGRVSTHLACLADCGYVASRRQGRRVFYRVADPRVADLVVLAHALAADNHTALACCDRIDAHQHQRAEHAFPPGVPGRGRGSAAAPPRC